MRYFAGLTWLNRGRVEVVGRMARNFVGRYGINYAHSSEGDIAIAHGHRPAITVSGPVAWITCPGPTDYGAVEDRRWSNRFINFAGERAEGMVRGGLLDLDRPVFPVAQPERVRAAFDQLYDRLAVEPVDQAQAVHDLEGLLLLLHAQRRTLASGGSRAVALAALCQRLRDAPEEPFDQRRVAADLGVSLPTFRRQFLHATGLPPHRYLLRARMARAATMLAGTALPVGDIAAAVGMGDAFQFAKCFRRHHQMTPTAWRDEARSDGPA